MATTTAPSSIQQLLGAKADSLLGFSLPKISKERLHLPGPDFIDRIFGPSDRNPRVLGSLQRMFNHGRLAGTGYLSILPWIRESNTPPRPASPKIPTTSTGKTSSSSPSKAAATPSHQPTAS